MASEAGKTLQRYHGALAVQVTRAELAVTTSRFRTNHRIEDGSDLLGPMGKILEAHHARVDGQSSPAEADQKTAAIINAVSTRAAH